MPDPRWPVLCKFVNGPLDAVVLPLDQIAADEEAGPVEAVMAVHANHQPSLVAGVVLIRRAQPVNQRDEIPRLLRRRRNLGNGREFMVLDAALIQPLGIINGTLMADIDNGFDPAFPIPHKEIRRMRIVDFPQRLHSAEDAGDGLRDRDHGLPFGQVLDVPFAFCGKMLQLPAEGESGVDVFVEKGVDEAG